MAQFKQAGAQLLVGTPGRIDDVMKRCALMDFKRLEVWAPPAAEVPLNFCMHTPSLSTLPLSAYGWLTPLAASGGAT